MSYTEVAYEIISQFVKSDEVDPLELHNIVVRSFEPFRSAGKVCCDCFFE
jgi:hypothetical protein